MAFLSAILAALKALGVFLGLIQTAQERQAGEDKAARADAEALARAEGKIAEIATEGQDDGRTVRDLSRGVF